MFADKLVASQNIYKMQEEIALLSKNFNSKVEKIFIAKINLYIVNILLKFVSFLSKWNIFFLSPHLHPFHKLVHFYKFDICVCI